MGRDHRGTLLELGDRVGTESGEPGKRIPDFYKALGGPASGQTSQIFRSSKRLRAGSDYGFGLHRRPGMRIVKCRISRLEDRFAPPQDEEPVLIVVVNRVDRELAMDDDACVKILREGGFLRGPSVRVVRLGDIPDGLNAASLEKFLLENGSRLT
jgi:hypothetical protein